MPTRQHAPNLVSCILWGLANNPIHTTANSTHHSPPRCWPSPFAALRLRSGLRRWLRPRPLRRLPPYLVSCISYLGSCNPALLNVELVDGACATRTRRGATCSELSPVPAAPLAAAAQNLLWEYLPSASTIPPLHGVSPSARSVGTPLSKRTSTRTTPAGHHPEGPVMGMRIEDSVVRIEGGPVSRRWQRQNRLAWGARAACTPSVLRVRLRPPHGNSDEQPPSEARSVLAFMA